MRQINEIILHCAATKPDWGANLTPQQQRDEIDRWHKANGWSGIGYHYIITRNGTVVPGRPIEKVGAHVKGHNTGTIGICLIGGHGSDANDAFADNFTAQQDFSARKLIDDLKEHFPSIKKITGHNQYARKACPGFQVSEWLKSGQTAKKSISQSTTLQASVAGATGAVTAGGAAIGSLDGDAQLILVAALVVVGLAFLWISKERIRKWANGDR